jgi:sRNA-binding regulator protein Hfq
MNTFTDLITVKKEVTLKDSIQLMFGEQLRRNMTSKRNFGVILKITEHQNLLVKELFFTEKFTELVFKRTMNMV